ncbi:endonuclease/exonuclease/phosphatase family protein, partial [Agrobacterium vitis]|uniref:endonuclease/exonuclease/phosphatase family protein n=1 Tax=Agrobacterium vitis TaxID=373 RepID=UPI003B51B02E
WAGLQRAVSTLKRGGGGGVCPTGVWGVFKEGGGGPGSALTRLEPLFGPLPPPVPSFPARLPVLALDRIMTNRPGLIAGMQVHDSPLARLASDHLPLKAWIDLDKAAEAVG